MNERNVTVGELRAALAWLPDDMPVHIGYEGILPPAQSLVVYDHKSYGRILILDEEPPRDAR